MTTTELREQMRALAAVERDQAPTLSWYLDLEDESGMEQTLYHGLVEHRLTMAPETRKLADEAMEQARCHLRSSLARGTRSVALFSRAGKKPFLRGFQFAVGIAPSASYGPSPRIYPLAEIADNYHRFGLVRLERDGANWTRVEVGEAGEAIPLDSGQRPATQPKRVRCVDAARNSIGAALETLERRLDAEQLDHWVLAGDAWALEAAEARLDHSLRRRLYGKVETGRDWSWDQVAARAARAYSRAEELESRRYARQLWLESSRGGMAVTGRHPSRSALLAQQAQTLVLLSRRSPRFHLNPELRDELVHLAQRADCHVEVVDESPLLAQLGGVGCLLRN